MQCPTKDQPDADPVKRAFDALEQRIISKNGDSVRKHEEKDWFLYRMLSLEIQHRLDDEALRRLRIALVDPETKDDGLTGREKAFSQAYNAFKAILAQRQRPHR